MTDYRTILEVIEAAGQMPVLPKGLEPAIKFVEPNWTTHGGFSWWQPGRRWVESPDGHFDPATCTDGGLHVANTIAAAQSGGARATHCLVVGVKPSECGPWENGKRKSRRVWVAGPVDLIGAVRRNGKRANLRYADLRRAYLRDAYLQDAYLEGAYLRDAYLQGAYLRDAYLEGADLRGAYLGYADLRGADLRCAYLEGANLRSATGYTP